MAEITGGELLLRCLHAEGVRHIHAITDGTYMMVIEAIERLGDELGIRLVVPRHEAAPVVHEAPAQSIGVEVALREGLPGNGLGLGSAALAVAVQVDDRRSALPIRRNRDVVLTVSDPAGVLCGSAVEGESPPAEQKR